MESRKSTWPNHLAPTHGNGELLCNRRADHSGIDGATAMMGSESLMVQVCLAPWVLPQVQRVTYLLGVSPFLEAALLCLSIPIRGYDDPNFRLPSAPLTLHL